MKQKQQHNVFYDKAYDYKEAKIPDSAFFYFNKAKELFLLQKNRLGVGKCLMQMGILYREKGDYFGGQEFSLNAIPFFDKKNLKHQIYIQHNLNNLGLISEDLGRYDEAIDFYQQALSFKVPGLILSLKNNLANAYRRTKAYDKSLTIYKNILKEDLNQEEFSRTLSNFAYTKWLQNPNFNAAPELHKALRIRLINNDFSGQNASFSHLSDYYSRKGLDSAFYYANRMYLVAKRLNSANDQLQALQKLIILSPNKETKKYFEIYNKLDDSVEISYSADKNQFALIRYNAQQNKLENLKLQKENTEKKYQIARREILFGITFLILITGSIIAILWYKKRKQKLTLEAENTIRENQLKTSKKVHDVVANGLYRVMTEIENQEGLDKEEMLDRLDHMYQKSRDISYEVEELKPINFQDKITDLLNSFTTKNTTVTIKGNSRDLWAKVNNQVKHEVEHILQELMVNMKKHSHATQVDIGFKQKDNRIHINYRDNGIGITKQVQYKNGLTNTGNRIKHIQGEITFDTNVEKGLKILISFPIA
ncbi:tetratricopeptide repeat protein [Pedobacter polaris]|uniref:histidine kinase n=1 Tax=Pedobacter polaris TaxID=2571273 RepID=A0A4U1CWJ8_9SPHI|nr:tetratricopeptide repeat protein [Pedobacter polaris]